MRFLLFLYLATLTGTLWGQSSVLSTGTWRKVSVAFDAVYKIDHTFLSSLGINPNGTDPRKIRIYTGRKNGMLPQPNNQSPAPDLMQISVLVVGGDDGKFDSGDYLLFFGEGPDRYALNPVTGTYSYINNFYTDKNFYFITVGSTTGNGIGTAPDLPGNFPTVAEFDDFGYYETDQTNELHSGRTWYGEKFESTLEYTIRFDQSGIVPGSSIKLITGVMGRSYAPSSFEFFLNNVSVRTQQVDPVLSVPYQIIGSEVHDTITVAEAAVGASARQFQDVRIRFTKAASGSSVAYLDYLLLHAKRSLSLYGDQKVFSSLKSLDQPVTRYVITNTTNNTLVWDVTDPHQPLIQQKTFATGATSFSATSDMLRKYIVVSNSNYPVPHGEGQVNNQNLQGIGATDLLVISAPEFLSEAERFAAHRRAKSGLNVSVSTTMQIYNEFSGGKQDVTALRDFVKFVFNKGAGLKNVLLFGRGSYDYKDKLSFNKNFVPLYQSRNSLSPLETYASDDYIGFLESAEGNWGENPPESNTMDVGVGRIPVKKLDEAAAWVDKVIAYENQNWGPWRKKILFVADDGDDNIHQGQSNQLATALETDNPEINTGKTFLDFFFQITTTGGQSSPTARKALSSAVTDGAGILNYTGHGSELQWMQERILDQVSFDEWKPAPRYPFLVTATCEFGRNDDPGLISSAELSIFKKKSGSIGLVTTSRPVYSSTNFTLNTAFYQSLFTKENGLFRDWGSVFRDTKNNSMSGVSNRNFSLLADPSMLPPIGSQEVVVSSITNLTSGSPTLMALSKVRVTGEVRFQGILDAGFNGTLALTLFDKVTPLTTMGDENAPFNFTVRNNALFRGQASIQQGHFDIEFIIPKSIDPVVGPGKVSLYAYSKESSEDGMGGETVLEIGSAEADPGTDSEKPVMELFMGDTTFVSGGLVSMSSRIVAILSDENGIDISNYDETNNITAILDDTLTIQLNDYYQADVDNYTRGKVDYPIDGLKPGLHTLVLRATDTFGNTSSTSITFYVSDQTGIQIEQWLNYPNPFSSSTIFHFKHNRSGEDLEAAVTIFDRMGKVVLYNTYQIGTSSYQVDLPSWDGTTPDGTKLPEGLYLMKLTVRSLLDGTKNERIAKVILLN